eukprot:Nitzschia sp. Nitz4//scaffold397_size11424//5985//7224//NITZ4_009041-RA/size11424-processed-gene-0.2-mRNA-1//1//CDS//3329550284//3815//frame0
MASFNVAGASLKYKNILVVIKQTAFEEYSQLKLRGQAPKALRWKRLEQRYKAHKQCVNDLLGVLRHNQVNFSCVNRVELDRQHLADVDLMVAVGGDGTVLSAAHFLDHGTIPLLGINSDPDISLEDRKVSKKNTDERRSHGALCWGTARNLAEGVPKVLYGESEDDLVPRTRIRCLVKSTFSETRLVPALNDLLIANPSPAAISRFRMGWLRKMDESEKPKTQQEYGTVTRFSGCAYDVEKSLNVWSSGMWVCTGTGSTAAMAAAGGQAMDPEAMELQYLIREHVMGNSSETVSDDVNNAIVAEGQKMHLRWNSQRGKIYIDGSHLTHNIELGDEIMIDNHAPPLRMFARHHKLGGDEDRED